MADNPVLGGTTYHHNFEPKNLNFHLSITERNSIIIIALNKTREHTHFNIVLKETLPRI